MILYVSLHTRGPGFENSDHWTIGYDQLEKGMYISQLLPSQYNQYVPSIHVKLSDDGKKVLIGKAEYPVDEEFLWRTPEIGLSYCSCTITLYFEPDKQEA